MKDFQNQKDQMQLEFQNYEDSCQPLFQESKHYRCHQYHRQYQHQYQDHQQQKQYQLGDDLLFDVINEQSIYQYQKNKDEPLSQSKEIYTVNTVIGSEQPQQKKKKRKYTKNLKRRIQKKKKLSKMQKEKRIKHEIIKNSRAFFKTLLQEQVRRVLKIEKKKGQLYRLPNKISQFQNRHQELLGVSIRQNNQKQMRKGQNLFYIRKFIDYFHQQLRDCFGQDCRVKRLIMSSQLRSKKSKQELDKYTYGFTQQWEAREQLQIALRTLLQQQVRNVQSQDQTDRNGKNIRSLHEFIDYFHQQLRSCFGQDRRIHELITMSEIESLKKIQTLKLAEIIKWLIQQWEAKEQN